MLLCDERASVSVSIANLHIFRGHPDHLGRGAVDRYKLISRFELITGATPETARRHKWNGNRLSISLGKRSGFLTSSKYFPEKTNNRLAANPADRCGNRILSALPTATAWQSRQPQPMTIPKIVKPERSLLPLHTFNASKTDLSEIHWTPASKHLSDDHACVKISNGGSCVTIMMVFFIHWFKCSKQIHDSLPTLKSRFPVVHQP